MGSRDEKECAMCGGIYPLEMFYNRKDGKPPRVCVICEEETRPRRRGGVIDSDTFDHVQTMLSGEETVSELTVKYNLRCEVCIFLSECRNIIKIKSRNDPYCFKDSKYHSRFLSHYGKREIA